MFAAWLKYKIAAAIAGPLTLIMIALVTAIASVVVIEDQTDAQAAGPSAAWCDPGGRLVARADIEDVPIAGESWVNAQTIVHEGTRLGVPDRAMVIAVVAALQESRLRNLDYGDRDSLGLFQMRPSQGWGTPSQLRDPRYASRKFYRVLLEVPHWNALPVDEAAQEVERSAFPDAYAQWVPAASQVVARINHTRCDSSEGLAASDVGTKVVAAAERWLATPYAWGGGNETGPTTGTCVAGAASNDCHVTGFDCSGLTLYAWYQATGDVHLPHQSQLQYAMGTQVDRNDVVAGDLLFFSSTGTAAGIHHVGIYMGDGQMIHAPQSGEDIAIVRDVWASTYYSSQFIGSRRYA